MLTLPFCTVAGHTLQLEVSPNITVSQLKLQVAEAFHFDVNHLRLIAQARILLDDQIISDLMLSSSSPIIIHQRNLRVLRSVTAKVAPVEESPPPEPPVPLTRAILRQQLSSVELAAVRSMMEPGLDEATVTQVFLICDRDPTRTLEVLHTMK
jgi:hypothetical protein